MLLNQAATAVNLTTNVSSIAYGSSVTFTAVVGVTTPGAGIPTGTVQFQVNGVNFSSPVGLTTSGDVASASFATSSLNVGANTVTAIYSGDATFTGSSDSVSTLTVTPAALTITALT